LPYLTQKARQKKIRLVQTISDDAVFYDQRNPISQAIFPEIPSSAIHKVVKFYSAEIDLFISHSQFLKELLVKGGISEDKIVHVPMFVDVSKYTPYYRSEDYFVYQYEPKDASNLKFLLKIMEEIPQHKLMVISKDKPDNEVKSLIEKYDLHNVLWVDNLNSSQKQNIVKLARFSIVLSGVSQKRILESYAQGKPVLAIDCGANGEYIVNTYSGLIFKNNKEDIINKIDYLMTNQQFCQDSGAFARNLVESCFDKQNHYRQIFNAFNAIEEKRAPQMNKAELLNIS
jgi:glycosyltransferase involved in cell wall biosynthesis